MFDKNARPKPRPGRSFLSSLSSIIQSVSALDGRIDQIPEVVHGDATNMSLPDGVADAVVTHPPYIGSVPYAEYGALSLMWLGHDPKDLDRRLTGGMRQTKDVVSRFEDGYAQMLLEVARVLRPGGRLFVMVGSPTVRGQVIDLAEMTRRLAVAADLKLVGEATRIGMNRRANKMGSEELFFFAKG